MNTNIAHSTLSASRSAKQTSYAAGRTNYEAQQLGGHHPRAGNPEAGGMGRRHRADRKVITMRTVMIRVGAIAFLWSLILTSAVEAASLDKAEAFRANGLLAEAKREAVEVLHDTASTSDLRADALLLLGDIALEERNVDLARQNWTKVTTDYPASAPARTAKEKLDVLARVPVPAPSPSTPAYLAGTVLVLGPEKYDWAALQIATARGTSAVPIEGSLVSAVKIAGENPGVVGILQVTLDVEAIFETGRLTCYRPNGTKSWDKGVSVNFGGGPDKIARRYVKALADGTKSRTCP